jgi:hypothetical protein
MTQKVNTRVIVRWRTLAWSLAVIVILTFAAANAHLVYVATTSQPSCVAHARLGEARGGSYSAAQSACPSPGGAGSESREKHP